MNRHLAVLENEIRNRARIYIHIYRELSKEVGADAASAILKRALYARGREKGDLLAGKLGKPDPHALAAAFMEGDPDMDAFGHEVVEEGPGFVVLRLNRCPLVEAWAGAGLAPEERKSLCDIAYQVDFGKFEAAGYTLSFRCRIADACGSCDMRVSI